ncbi:MAG: hypothetical protein LBL21_00755 [Rickettsiales bacterium]|nr:hypothetical protein [Rickettsiales bacterium]
MASFVIRGSWFVGCGCIRVIIVVLFSFIIANHADAAVGLCVKDDSIAKIATVGEWGDWGDGWTVRSADGQYIVDGTAACLSTNAKNGTIPSSWNFGANCWCSVTRINDKAVSGAWVFHHTYAVYTDCNGNCAFGCSYCARFGTDDSCTRSALFATP